MRHGATQTSCLLLLGDACRHLGGSLILTPNRHSAAARSQYTVPWFADLSHDSSTFTLGLMAGCDCEVAAADLRRVEVLRRRVRRVHVQEVDLDAAQRRVVHHAVLPPHVAGVQDRLAKTQY